MIKAFIKKGSACIFQGSVYTVYERKNNFAWIYNPAANIPELTMMTTHVKNLSEVNNG